MKIIFILSLWLGLALANSASTNAPTPSLLAKTIKANRWKKRLLLIVAPSVIDPYFKRQKALLTTVANELRERDFLVIDALTNQLSAVDKHYLMQTIKLKNTGFAVVLIGKDGGVKRTETKPIDPADLFEMVDKMPMRREEMSRK